MKTILSAGTALVFASACCFYALLHPAAGWTVGATFTNSSSGRSTDRHEDGRAQQFLETVCEGRMGDARGLLQEAPDLLHWTDPEGDSILHLLLYRHPVEPTAVRWLLERGWDPNAKTLHGTTPLIVAAVHQDVPVLEALLEQGADPGLRDNGGHTAIFSAGSFDRAENVQFLLSWGAKPDIFEASALGLTHEVSALLDANPSLINEREQEGHANPVELAATHRRAALLRFLLARHPELDIYTAAAAGQIGFLEIHLTRNSPAVNARDPFTGSTALRMAVLGGDTRTIGLLLDYGAAVNVNMGGPFPSSPLALAIQRGDKDSVKLLAQHGADTKRFYPGFGNASAQALAHHRPDIAELVK
jgi:ankyrin repeat protein